MSTFQLADRKNSTIECSGMATFGPNQFCTWKTPEGLTSICKVTNPSSNTLYFVITGAPDTARNTDGGPLNGLYSIPPNSPTTCVQAIGDFLNHQILIANTTNTVIPADCHFVTFASC